MKKALQRTVTYGLCVMLAASIAGCGDSQNDAGQETAVADAGGEAGSDAEGTDAVAAENQDEDEEAGAAGT